MPYKVKDKDELLAIIKECDAKRDFTKVENLDISNISNLSLIFYDCENLTTLDLIKWDVSNVKDMYGTFTNCYNLQTLKNSNWKVSNVENMNNMFCSCQTLQTLDISEWDVSNVKYMCSMFYCCHSLKDLDISKWNVSNVRRMRGMFYSCCALEKLDLSKWNVSNIRDMKEMFYSCECLEKLDISKWDVSNVSDMSFIFYGCHKLQELNISNWNVSKVKDMSYMFSGCQIFEDEREEHTRHDRRHNIDHLITEAFRQRFGCRQCHYQRYCTQHIEQLHVLCVMDIILEVIGNRRILHGEHDKRHNTHAGQHDPCLVHKQVLEVLKHVIVLFLRLRYTLTGREERNQEERDRKDTEQTDGILVSLRLVDNAVITECA